MGLPLSAGRLSIIVCSLGLIAGCAGQQTVAARPETGNGSGLTAARASTILSGFDAADSAATVAGDEAGLRQHEADPVLYASLAAVQRNAAAKRSQPGYRHTNPTYALPAAGNSCFMVAATLQSSGAELGNTDLSQFVRDSDGAWRMTHNVQVGQESATEVHAIATMPARQSSAAAPDRLAAVAGEIFNRTTGSGSANLGLVARSSVLDRQLAAGWQIYQRQLAPAGMQVSRSRSGTTWSACTAMTGQTALTFLTLNMTDTVTPAPGSKKPATMSPRSPDLAGLGHPGPVSGRRIAIHRVEVFLISIPPQAAASVLGLTDAPVSLDVVP